MVTLSVELWVLLLVWNSPLLVTSLTFLPGIESISFSRFSPLKEKNIQRDKKERRVQEKDEERRKEETAREA